MRVPARVYDVESGAIFAKYSTFVFFDGFAWTPRLRSPFPIMAPALKLMFLKCHKTNKLACNKLAGNILACLPVYGSIFIAQMIEHCSANAEAMGSNPVEVPKNFFWATSQLLKLRLNCEGHIFISQDNSVA